MNLTWLDDFLALAASGNFSRAAEERHMTQPAFSRRIRGARGVARAPICSIAGSHPATLTVAGEWFQDKAHELIAAATRLPAEARAVSDRHSTTLRFASTHALSFTFLPQWLRQLESRTPIGPVTLVSDVFARCEEMLLDSQVQFVLTHAHPDAPSQLQALAYPHFRIGVDVLMAVSAPKAAKRPLHSLLADKAGAAALKTLSYSGESGIGRIVSAVRGKAIDGRATQNVFTAHLSSALRIMALDGRGMAWLPKSLINADLDSGRLVAAAPAGWDIDVEIRIYRNRCQLGHAAESIWSTVAKISDDR